MAPGPIQGQKYHKVLSVFVRVMLLAMILAPMASESPEQIPCLSFVAPGGTGKTTLLANVIQELVAKGVDLAVLKSSHHDHHLDLPGKDTCRFAEAGAPAVALLGPGMGTIFLEYGSKRAGLAEFPTAAGRPRALDIAAWLAKAPFSSIELVLCEGFSDEKGLAKLRVVRGPWPEDDVSDPDLLAVAWDGKELPVDLAKNVPLLPLDAKAVSAWIQAHVGELVQGGRRR